MPTEITAAIIGGVAAVIAALILVCAQSVKNLNTRKQNAPKDAWIINDAEKYTKEIQYMLNSAKTDIIVTGGTLSDLNVHRLIIDEIVKKNITVRLLALDIEKDGILDAYNNLIERSGKVKDLLHLSRFEGNENIKINKLDSLPLAYFIASDMESQNGTIMAIHLLSKGERFLCVRVTRSDNEWYNLYHEQIKSLWEEGCLYSSSKAGTITRPPTQAAD